MWWYARRSSLCACLALLLTAGMMGAELASLGADIVVRKDGKRSAKLLVGTSFLAKLLRKSPGETLFTGSDSEALQRAIDLLNDPPRVSGGSIWIRGGTYRLKKQGLVLPLPSYPYRIFGDGIDRTVLVYRGKGEAIGYGTALWKSSHNNVLTLSDFTLRITSDARFGIRILTSNFSTVERVRIVASKGSRPYCAISNEGPGGQTKLFENLAIEGPFEVGVFISTDHMTLVGISVEGFRRYGFQGGWDALCFAKLRAGRGALAGITGGKRRAGYVRCNMAHYDLNIREFYWRYSLESWGMGALAEVEDLSPPRKGYATVAYSWGWGVLALRSPPRVQPVRTTRGSIITVLEETLWGKLRPEPPPHLSSWRSEPDIVVFKEKGLCKAQVAGGPLVESLGSATVIAQGKDDSEVIQKACDAVPAGGRLVLEEARYQLSRPIVIRKRMAMDGLREWCYLVRDNKTQKMTRPLRAGTIITSQGDCFVVESAGRNPLPFTLSHIQFDGVRGRCVVLRNTSALLENLRLTRCSSPSLVIEGGKGNVVQMVTGGGKPAIDDRGLRTLVISNQHFSTTGAVRLGMYGAVIGGHINNSAIITQPLGLDKWAVVIGNKAEGGSPKCYVADNATLYLLSAGGGHPGVAEINGGKVVVLGK